MVAIDVYGLSGRPQYGRLITAYRIDEEAELKMYSGYFRGGGIVNDARGGIYLEFRELRGGVFSLSKLELGR